MTARMLSPSARGLFLAATLVSAYMAALPALAQSGTTVPAETGTVIIEQVDPSTDVKGSWTLLLPDRSKVALSRSYTLESTLVGTYTLIATLPQGAAASTTLSRNGVQENTVNVPQTSFTLHPGETVKVTLAFTFTRTGIVSATSSPLGLAFHIKGPNQLEYTGVTPASFLDVPEGLYTIQFDPIPDCATPAPESDRLTKGGRIAFSITIACEALKDLPQTQVQEKRLQYVTVTIDGAPVTFEDVPVDGWFAPFVSSAIKTGIMSGYQDENGAFTGRFGPGDDVTLAQLLKIAHGVAGIDEQKARGTPDNLTAQSTWFTRFTVSAEQEGWLVVRDRRTDLNRPATRAEVVCTLLQALDVPRLWPKGTTFYDVTRRTAYADCIETAAHDGVIAGIPDGAGGIAFHPEQPINRAEIAKMIATATATYVERSAEIQGNYAGQRSSASSSR